MDYCLYLDCYSQNVSADVTSDLQVYLLELMNLSVKLRKLHKILNRTVYLIHDGNILSFCIYFIIKNILWVDISVTERGCVYGSDMQMIELFAKWRHGKEKEKDYKKKNVCTDQESQSHFFFGELPGNKCRCFNGEKMNGVIPCLDLLCDGVCNVSDSNMLTRVYYVISVKPLIFKVLSNIYFNIFVSFILYKRRNMMNQKV